MGTDLAERVNKRQWTRSPPLLAPTLPQLIESGVDASNARLVHDACLIRNDSTKASKASTEMRLALGVSKTDSSCPLLIAPWMKVRPMLSRFAAAVMVSNSELDTFSLSFVTVRGSSCELT